MRKKKPAKKSARRKARQPAAPAPAVVQVPGRRTVLTEQVAREVSGHVANCASFKDACLLSGVEERTGLLWLSKGEAAVRAGGPTVPNEHLYVQFLHLVEGGKARRRTLLKLQMRRAAQGTATKPGDWRAAEALGKVTDPEEFVAQQKVLFVMEREEALDRLEAAFANAPEQLTRDEACELALLAVAGRVRLDTVATAIVGAAGGDSSIGGGSGEAVHPPPAVGDPTGVPRPRRP